MWVIPETGIKIKILGLMILKTRLTFFDKPGIHKNGDKSLMRYFMKFFWQIMGHWSRGEVWEKGTFCGAQN